MQPAQPTEAEIRLLIDNGGRRLGGDRRVIYSYHGCIPERRTGNDRRSGEDRRKKPRSKLGFVQK
jgi:hypothetical protein